jgi:hypothetical protein
MTMMTERNRIRAGVGLLVTMLACTPAWANLLVDPGFEANPLTSYSNVLTNFTGFQGQWGGEVALITGFENGVTPPEGVDMLRMDDDGLITTQTFQVTDVTSYAAIIDAGSATATLDALFNVDAHVPAATGGVYIQFFSASNYGSQIGTGLAGPLALDALDTTWETAAVTTGVPVGTRWILSQVYYSDASLLGVDGVVHGGYVDAADLRVTPEPATLGLLAMGAFAMLRRRHA